MPGGTAGAERHIDFNASAGGPTESGYLGLPPQVYVSAATNGLGWLTMPMSAERAGPNALLRDLHYGANERVFTVDVVPGRTYQVTITAGVTTYSMFSASPVT